MGEKPKGVTQLVTFDLYNSGITTKAIAARRQLTTGSVASHLVRLAKAEYDIYLSALTAPTDRREIEKAIVEVSPEEGRLKPVFDHLSGRYDYGKLTLVAELL